jgi:hypothetical protein
MWEDRFRAPAWVHGVSTARKLLIYLTPHFAPPQADVDESLAIEPNMRLAWLSWRDVWAAIRASLDQNRVPQAVLSVAEDLVVYLEHVGLVRFRSFDGSQEAIGSTSWRCFGFDGFAQRHGPTVSSVRWTCFGFAAFAHLSSHTEIQERSWSLKEGCA